MINVHGRMINVHGRMINVHGRMVNVRRCSPPPVVGVDVRNLRRPRFCGDGSCDILK